jgi:hypothetical protein
MKRILRSAAFLLPLAMLVGACDDGTGSGTGHVSLLMTDAPGDVAAAWVTVNRIYLQPGDEGEPDGEGDMDGDGLHRVDLLNAVDEVTLNLTLLSDEVVDVVVQEPVPAGLYQQLRVVVEEACIAVETADEGVYDYYATPGFDPGDVDPEDVDGVEPGPCVDASHLQTPSLGQTGIKVQLDGGFEVLSDVHSVAVLDFDASESFGHQAGQQGKWVMHPVIRGALIGLSSSLTVNLSAVDGLEFPEIDGEPMTLGDFVADLSTEEEDAPFTDEDEDGVYTARFNFLVPSDILDFIVTVQPPESVAEDYEFTFDPVEAEVDLLSGQDIVVDFELTGIAETP